MRSSATTGAGLVQPLSARVAAFRPVSRSQKNSVVGQAVPECKQVGSLSWIADIFFFQVYR